jgi:hypothetical protein
VNTADWRLVLAYTGRTPWRPIDQLAKALDDHDPHRREDGAACLYAAGETSARAAFVQAEHVAEFQHVRLEHWVVEQGKWTTVATAGEPIVGREPLPSWLSWRSVTFWLSSCILGGLFLYYSPAGEFSAGVGHVHDLNWTLEGVLIVNVIAGLFCAFRSSSSRT